MNVMYRSSLFGKDKKGSIRKWSIEVRKIKNKAVIQKMYGLLEGKQITNEETISLGKNIGKENETTCVEQAIFEAKSSRKKQLDKGYVKKVKDIKTLFLPMLVSEFDNLKKHITYPCYGQPKKNGIRSLIRKKNTAIDKISRKGKAFITMDHLNGPLKRLLKVLPGLDGELFNKKLTFSQISSSVKKYGKNSKKIQYWVFDTLETNTDYYERLKRLKGVYFSLSKKDKKLIKFVPTYLIKSEAQAMRYYKKFKANEDEGLILRNKLGSYVFQFSSVDVQKYKGTMVDSEFKIVGTKKDKRGGIVFIVEIENGNTFSAVIKGSIVYRKKLWKRRESFIGKLLTVKYQNLSDDGIPIFPNGLAIRDYE